MIERIREAVEACAGPSLADIVANAAAGHAARSPDIGGGTLWIFSSPSPPGTTIALPPGTYPNYVRVVWYEREVECHVSEHFPIGPEAYARWIDLPAAPALQAIGPLSRSMVSALLRRDRHIRTALSWISPPLPGELVLTDVLRTGPWGAWVEALLRRRVCEGDAVGPSLTYFFVAGISGLSVFERTESWDVASWRVAHDLQRRLGIRPEVFLDWTGGRLSRDEWEAEVAMARLAREG